MDTKKVKEKTPEIYQWYIVKCPDWCESGFAVAQWDGENWFDNSGRNDFDEYVTEYWETPLNEL